MDDFKRRCFVIYILLWIIASANCYAFECNGYYFWQYPSKNKNVAIYNPELYSSEEEYQNYQFPLENNTLNIPTNIEYNNQIFTPISIDGVANQNDLKEISIPSTIYKISNIRYCPSLENLNLDDVVCIENFDGPSLPKLKTLNLSNIEEMEGVILGPWIETLYLPKQINMPYWERDFGNDAINLRRITLPDWKEGGRNGFVNEFVNSPNLQEIYCRSQIPWNCVHIIESGSQPPASIPSSQSGETNSADDGTIWEYTNVGGAYIDFSSCIVYVPVGSLADYQNHPSWSKFYNIVEYDMANERTIPDKLGDKPSLTIINGTILCTNDTIENIYDVWGHEVTNYSLLPGLYIIKLRSGNTRKFLMR